MVGRLVEQQQVGVGEQRRGQRHPHAPAAGVAVHRPGLRRGVEAEPGQDRRPPAPAPTSAPIARSRSWISARRQRVRRVLLGQQARRRSVSVASTVSIRLAGPDGASCRTWAMRARADSRISPPSTPISPAMARSSVVLPAPLRPTSPIRRPGSTRSSAPSSRVRPADAQGHAIDDEQAHGARLPDPARPCPAPEHGLKARHPFMRRTP